MIGTCALCQKNADLQNSHLIPKWAYRRVCDFDRPGAKAPVQIAGGNAVLINKQTTKYLLCPECEQLFSKYEDYVSGLTESDDGQIKLFKDIKRHDTPKKMLASLNEEVDGDQIAYFAASVMWRGCVMTGAASSDLMSRNFGTICLEQRDFLLRPQFPSGYSSSRLMLMPVVGFRSLLRQRPTLAGYMDSYLPVFCFGAGSEKRFLLGGNKFR